MTNFVPTSVLAVSARSFMVAPETAPVSDRVSKPIPPPAPILTKTVAEIAQALESGEITSEELVKASLARIEETRQLNAFVTVLKDEALEAARASDARRRAGQARRSLLDGVPIAIKDNFCMQGTLTTAASGVLSTFVSPYTATVVQRLIDAGAVIVGKTNMDEFGMGSFNLNSHSGPCYHPASSDAAGIRSPGGSSGGSAVAVATCATFVALGSDTGGSVRLPASYCGLVGLKPTYGLLSRWGLIAYGSSLDCPGIITRTSECAKATLELIQGQDELDSTCIHTLPKQDIPTDAGSTLKGLRVGLPVDLNVTELPFALRKKWQEAADTLASLGCEIVPVNLPSLRAALPCYYTIAPAEAVSNLSRYDGVRYGPSTFNAEVHEKNYLAALEDSSKDSGSTKGNLLERAYTDTRSKFFGKEVQRRIFIGNFVLSSGTYRDFYHRAMVVREQIRSELSKVLGDSAASSDNLVDILLFPTATSTAPLVDEIATHAKTDPVRLYLDDLMTVFANLSGLPALNVPVGDLPSDAADSAGNGVSLPVGMQLMGPALSERRLLEVGRLLQSRLSP